MASISITNVSVNYAGIDFQGKVDFDINCTPTESRLNVGFRINLAAQLNFETIDYGSNEVAEWCKKIINLFGNNEMIAKNVVKQIRENSYSYSVKPDVYMTYLDQGGPFDLYELLEKVTPVNFYKALIRSWGYNVQEKVQLFNMSVAYPEGQSSSSHSVEFSISRGSLFHWNLEELELEFEPELRDEFLACAGHQLDISLSAEPDWGNANTQGRFEYNAC